MLSVALGVSGLLNADQRFGQGSAWSTYPPGPVQNPASVNFERESVYCWEGACHALARATWAVLSPKAA